MMEIKSIWIDVSTMDAIKHFNCEQSCIEINALKRINEGDIVKFKCCGLNGNCIVSNEYKIIFMPHKDCSNSCIKQRISFEKVGE